MTDISVLDPCWVCRTLKNVVFGILLFIVFGFVGKSLAFSKEHGLSRWECIWIPRFWTPDGIFFLWGTIGLLIAFFGALFVHLVWKLFKESIKGIFKGLCGRRRRKDRSSESRIGDLEKALFVEPAPERRGRGRGRKDQGDV